MTKENDGRGARRIFVRRMVSTVGYAALLFLSVGWLLQHDYFSLLLSRMTGNSSRSHYHSKISLQHQRHRVGLGAEAVFGKLRGGGARDVLQQQQNHNNINNKPEILHDIVTGRLHLIDAVVVKGGGSTYHQHDHHNNNNNKQENADAYQDGIVIMGEFCQLDWSLHKFQPSTFPMFRDLVVQSHACQRTRVSYDLYQAAHAAKQYDYNKKNIIHILNKNNNNNDEAKEEDLVQENNNNNKEKNDDAAVHVLQLGGFVFHESRCGSTLTANLLATMYPARHRVYSESTPPLAVIHQLCNNNAASCQSRAATVLADVLYLMSRSNDRAETTVFFKIQSIGTRYLNIFQSAVAELSTFSTTTTTTSHEQQEEQNQLQQQQQHRPVPYIFVYRQPVQVLASQLAHGIAHANCVVPQKSSVQPTSVLETLRHHGIASSQQASFLHVLKPEQYCALHLASITESALQQLKLQQEQELQQEQQHEQQQQQLPNNVDNVSKRSSMVGVAVNYADMPDLLYHSIFPHHFGLDPITPDALQRMHETALQYSKARSTNTNNKNGGELAFQGDSEEKEAAATFLMKQAAQEWLQSSFDQLQVFANQYKQKHGIATTTIAADVAANQ